MKNLFCWIILLTVFGSGCSIVKSDEYSLPNKFKDRSAYTLSDFHLNSDYTYWEVRRPSFKDTSSYNILYAYDASTYQSLSAEKQQQFEAATTQRGFVPLCIPGGCTGYGVALKGNTVELIDGKNDLLAFFGPIDTEAELSFLLWTRLYELISYKDEESGYLAIIRLEFNFEVQQLNL